MEPATYQRRRESADLGPLFARPSAAEKRRDRERLKERLAPIVDELAKRRGGEGITASEVITEGILRGVLNKDAIAKAPKIYAWIGPWLAVLARRGLLSAKMAQLQGGGQVHVERASQRDGSHRNQGKVYLHPEVRA